MSSSTKPKTLDFNCAVITGGSGGLGKAMAEYLAQKEGKKVILVGRTEDKLKEVGKQLNAPYYTLDTGEQ
jgi:short-subunit dehydrogenase